VHLSRSRILHIAKVGFLGRLVDRLIFSTSMSSSRMRMTKRVYRRKVPSSKPLPSAIAGILAVE